jgi:hypothetical protein
VLSHIDDEVMADSLRALVAQKIAAQFSIEGAA